METINFKARDWKRDETSLFEVKLDLGTSWDLHIEGELGQDLQGFTGVELDGEGGHLNGVNGSNRIIGSL